MNGRHQYEAALELAIRLRNITEFRTLTQLVKNRIEARLFSRNEEGHNFLVVAFRSSAISIAAEILEQLKEYPETFAADPKKRTPLWHLADSFDHPDFYKQFFTAATETLKDNARRMLFECDEDGVTPLHNAARHGHLDGMRFLLSAIRTEKNAIDLINYADDKGDTPLHYCFKFIMPDCIAALIQHGADVLIANNEKITPLSLLVKLSSDTQERIVSLLEKPKRETLLSQYREYMIDHPEDQALRRSYFSLVGVQSLTALMLAQHECNDVPVQRSYHQVRRASYPRNGKLVDFPPRQDGSFALHEQEMPIPDELLERMPRYHQKLNAELNKALRADIADPEQPVFTDNEQDMELKPLMIPPVLIEQAKPDAGNESLKRYQLLDRDRALITNIVLDMSQFVSQLEQQTSPPYYNRLLGVLTSSGCLILSAGILTLFYFIGELTATEQKYGNNTYKEWSALYLIFYLIGALIGALASLTLSIYFCVTFCQKQRRVSPGEYQSLLNTLEQEILFNLKLLESRTTENESYLPVDAAIVRQLEEKLPLLQQKSLVNDAIKLLSEVKTLLETLRKDMNRSNKPLSFFAPKEVVIPVTEEREEEDHSTEHDPLIERIRI